MRWYTRVIVGAAVGEECVVEADDEQAAALATPGVAEAGGRCLVHVSPRPGTRVFVLDDLRPVALLPGGES